MIFKRHFPFKVCHWVLQLYGRTSLEKILTWSETGQMAAAKWLTWVATPTSKCWVFFPRFYLLVASGWVVLSGTKGRILLHSRTFAQYLRFFSSFSVLSVCAYKNYVATGSLDRTIKWGNHQFLLSCVLFQHVCVLSDCVSPELLTRKFVLFYVNKKAFLCLLCFSYLFFSTESGMPKVVHCFWHSKDIR